MGKCLTCPNVVKVTFEGETKESVVSCALYKDTYGSGSTIVRDVMNGEVWMCPLDKTVDERIAKAWGRIGCATEAKE